MSAPALPTMTVEQDRLYREASALLTTLNAVFRCLMCTYTNAADTVAVINILDRRIKLGSTAGSGGGPWRHRRTSPVLQAGTPGERRDNCVSRLTHGTPSSNPTVHGGVFNTPHGSS